MDSDTNEGTMRSNPVMADWVKDTMLLTRPSALVMSEATNLELGNTVYWLSPMVSEAVSSPKKNVFGFSG